MTVGEDTMKTHRVPFPPLSAERERIGFHCRYDPLHLVQTDGVQLAAHYQTIESDYGEERLSRVLYGKQEMVRGLDEVLITEYISHFRSFCSVNVATNVLSNIQ